MHPLMRRVFAIGSSLFLLSSALPAFAQVGACGQYDRLTDANKTVADNVSRAMREDFSTFNCRNVSDVRAEDRERGCVPGLCAGGRDIMCCAPGIGGREGTADDGGTTAETGAAPGGFLQLQLPACVTSRDPDVAGRCSLDDIVRTGVAFANLLFGISGAILLATFVYGGVLYLTAGSSGNVSKAKDMIKNALIGMVLVFGAGLLVQTVYDTFRAGSSDTGAAETSGTETP